VGDRPQAGLDQILAMLINAARGQRWRGRAGSIARDVAEDQLSLPSSPADDSREEELVSHHLTYKWSCRL